jgi:hypothetical protein
MKFLKVEWTKKRGAIALLATSLVVTSFILGGFVATGNWNPWGNRHYYQVLNANFQECYTPVGGTPQCQSAHNVIFDASAKYVEQVVEKGAATPALCAIGATCSFNFIAMTTNAVAPTAGMTSTGATNGQCGNAGTQGGTELTTGGFLAAAGAVTDITGSTGAQSTVVKIFTATAITTVAQSCLVNESTIDANRVNLAAQTFTAITLQIGDTIQITWTLTWNWS